jgi:4-amino-4-deoxychorismate lyase
MAYAHGVTKRAVAVLGRGRVDAGDPVLAADDLGLTRGDGCFEATRVVTDDSGSHRIDHLAEHLDRLQVSCTGLAMPDIGRPAWVELIDQVLTDWDLPGEAMLKLMATRGRESDPSGPITGIATVTPIAEHVLAQRRDGLSVVTLNRGTTSDAFAAAPWLLGGVKTLSYGVNVAAVRAAAQRGADDVIFTSSDGYVLEGPTSAVVWLSRGQLNTTPAGGTGILASITQRALFAAAEQAGVATGYTLGTTAELRSADGVWLVSSGRGVAQVHTLNRNRLIMTPGLSDQIAALSGC